MVQWYAYKKHYQKKNHLIESKLPSFLKNTTKAHSKDLTTEDKIIVKKGDTFTCIGEESLYYIVEIPLKNNNTSIPTNETSSIKIDLSSKNDNVIKTPPQNLPLNKKAISDKIYISLGWKCNSAVVRANTFHLKSPQYKTCPFDLMISNLPGIIKCFEDDFQYFCDPQYLIYNGKNYIKNTYYHFMFNHETPGHADLHLKEQWPGNDKFYFTKNNFHEFINRYKRRIDNLRNYINENNHIIFILETVNPRQNHPYLLQLKKILHTNYPNKSFSFYLIAESNKDFFTTHWKIAGMSPDDIKLLF
jgi:hypothetical protein